MSLLILILICLLVWNVSLIWKGGRDSAITLAVVNAIPAGLLLLLELSFDGGAWYFCVSWIAMALLVIGLLSGWALRFWNVKRLLVWCACFALAIGGAYAGGAYEQHLRDITLREHFDYTTYTPFQADSLVKTLDEEPALRFAEGDPLPKMDGATALYPVYAAFAQAVYPSSAGQMEPWEVWEIVNCSTTSTAYRKIVDGNVDIIFVAGPSKEQEAYAAEKGVELVYTPIGREAFVFFVHPDNPLEGLTLEQIRSVYSGETTQWDQLGVRELGSIRAYQRKEGSGSQTALERFVMRDTPLMPAEKEMVQDSMGGMVEQVSDYRNHKNAIGYSFRFYCTALMKNFHVKLLAVNGIAPTIENIESGAYPLASEFYAVTRKNTNENTLALLRWIQGPQGQALIEKTGYTPLASAAEPGQEGQP